MTRIGFMLALVVFFAVASDAQNASAPPAPRKPATASPAKPAADAQLYRNATFGFRYKIPYGWVDRTKEMNDQPSEQKSPAAGDQSAESKASSQGQVLLAAFERPPDAPGDTVNSAVVIVTESASAYPGLTKAEDYLGPLTELATAKGFKPAGDPEDIEIDSRQLIRADFAKPLGPAKEPTKANDTLTMHQSTLVLLAKGQILSFTFIAGSEDEIDDLIEGLHLGPGVRR
jgi:hypothetical protein